MSEETENFMVEALYRDVVGEFSRYKNEGVFSRNALAHWIVPSPNLNTNPLTEIPSHSQFNYKVYRPRPFLSPANVNPRKYWDGDPLDVIVREKQKWECHLNRLLSRAKAGRKWAVANDLAISKVKKNTEQKHLYTVDAYMDVAVHLEKDPHPAFSGGYNWLYTGGCITSCTLNEEKFLLHPSGENMDTLCVTGIRQQLAGENQVSTSLPLCKGQRIHQIVENKGLVGIKQENVCSLARIKGGSEKPLSAQTHLEIQEKDGFFVSIDLGRLEGKLMCTTDSKRLIKLWDLTTSSCTSTAKVPSSENKSKDSSWSFIKFNNKSPELFVLNKSAVFVKDLRMPLSNNCMEFSPSRIIDDCEELALLLNSEGLPLTYIGTTHQLLSLDTRFGWNQRWTHLMEAPPMYGSIYCSERNSEEVILLSSSIPDDSIAIVNTWEYGQPMSESLPRSFQSLRDTLILARSHGECLGISLKQRLDMATSGVTVVPSENNNGFISFKSTSIGDVFYQHFVSEPYVLDSNETASSKEETDIDVKAWKNWAEANDVVCSQNSGELHCPVYSHNFVFNAIRAPLSENHNDPLVKDLKTWHKTFPVKEKRKRNKQEFPFEHNSKSIGQVLNDLSSHTDLMAGVLLQAWDSKGLHAEPNPAQYVESWLGDVSTSDERPIDEDGFSLNQSTSSIAPHSPLASSLMTTSMSESADVFKVPATPFSQPSKKRKRESIGF